MSQQFQVFVDARGDLSAADGVVIDQGTGDVFAVGDGAVRPGVVGSLAPTLDTAVEIPRMQGISRLGGSSRNVLISSLAALSGVWRPGRPGIWTMEIYTLEVTGSSAATISDEDDVIAELTTGGTAPVGSYVATAYGETTYNGGSPFTLTGAGESGFPGAPNDLEVAISAGTAMGGGYTSTDGVNYVSAVDPDWTITLNSDGSAELSYDGTVMAERASGPVDDPCGIYEATEAGEAINPEFPALAEEEPAAVNPFGTLTIEFTWAGTPDLDIGVSFLGVTVGYGYASSAPYVTWSGDNTTDGGPETVEIDLAAAWDAGEISSYADVLGAADWYPPAGGSGPAAVSVTYDLPGSPGTPVTHTIHPSSATPAVTPAIGLRILAAGTVAAVGGPWNATVSAVRKAPIEGVAYIAITETAGDITAVSGPDFADALPTSGGGVTYFPIATSDGTGGLKQLHTGALLW